MIQWCISSGVSALHCSTRFAVIMTKAFDLKKRRRRRRRASCRPPLESRLQQLLTSLGCPRHKPNRSFPHPAFPERVKGQDWDTEHLTHTRTCTLTTAFWGLACSSCISLISCSVEP